jgi:hypothetical protein
MYTLCFCHEFQRWLIIKSKTGEWCAVEGKTYFAAEGKLSGTAFFQEAVSQFFDWLSP